MQLSEHKTYRTRDGSRTGIRVRKNANSIIWNNVLDENQAWFSDGRCNRYREYHTDLIEEQLATPQPFSYDACPVGEDGRRRAVTRDGREVILVAGDGPGYPIGGWIVDGTVWGLWRADGTNSLDEDACDLLVPPLPKRVVWVNLYERGGEICAYVHETLEGADNVVNNSGRIGNRAYPIEIDA